MNTKSQHLAQNLRGKLFLSSMMGLTDGTFCAERGKGCTMVQLGAYLAEPTATAEDMGRDAASFLPADPKACTAFLARECDDARLTLEVATCLNLATPKLEWGLEAGKCFAHAGGDLLELNVHGGYGRYLQQGKLRAMVEPEHRDELFRWVEALTKLDIPLIVKLNGQSARTDLFHILSELAARDLLGVHLNVRHAERKKPDLDLVREAKRQYPGFLFVSGYVRSTADARALFKAGADMVGIAEPTIADPAYIASHIAADDMR